MNQSEKKVQQSAIADDQIHTAKSDIAGIFRLVSYSSGLYWPIFGCLLLVFLSSVCYMLSARYLGKVAEILTANFNQSLLTRIAVIVIFLEIFAMTLQYLGRVSLSYLTNRIVYNVRLKLFGKINHLPISYFDRQPLGRTLTRLTADVEGVERFFSGTLASLVISLIAIFTVLVTMVITDVRFGSLIVLSALPALIFTLFTRGPIVFWLRVMKRRNARLNSKLAEFINGIKVIKLFGLERWSFDEFNKIAKSHFDSAISVMNWNSYIRPTTALLCTLPTAVILWYGGYLVLSDALSLALFVTFVRYSERFLHPIMTISQEIQVIQEALSSSERINQMLIEEEEDIALGSDGNVTQKINGHIAYDQVGMSYGNGEKVLRGVSFKVEPGLKVGLVGATGSGKSSTINLIPLLYPFQEGMIYIDGIPLNQWSRLSIRQQIGIVSQDVIIFRGTLRENLLGAISDCNKSVTEDQILEACARTGLMNYIHHFPKGLDSWLIDSGENLSLGERQLIALTRMLLRDPAILILDEATASIDEQSEAIVQKALAETLVGRTCFVIAHRLNTVLNCDYILVFKNGEIVEQGNHQQLLKMNGYYRKLWNYAEAYREPSVDRYHEQAVQSV